MRKSDIIIQKLYESRIDEKDIVPVLYKKFPDGRTIYKYWDNVYILSDKNGNHIATFKSEKEIKDAENSVRDHKKELTPKMIGIAKKAGVWEPNPFDTQYGGSISNWDVYTAYIEKKYKKKKK